MGKVQGRGEAVEMRGLLSAEVLLGAEVPAKG